MRSIRYACPKCGKKVEMFVDATSLHCKCGRRMEVVL